MNKNNKEIEENALYLKLQKDIRLKKKQKHKREYIPAAIFQNPECIKVVVQINKTLGRKSKTKRIFSEKFPYFDTGEF